MHGENDRPEPPEHVLAAFHADGLPTPLPGGRGLAWRAGSVVVKPADMDEETLAWHASALGAVSDPGLRVAMPLRSIHGAFVVDGWIASSFCEGSQWRGRWLEIVRVGGRLHAALTTAACPDFLVRREDAWAKADRAAWGDSPLVAYLEAPHVARLASLLAPVDAPSQVIHGDLTGNVLFADPLPPAVIDFSAYWRPAPYATAIVVADALAWEGATAAELGEVTAGEGFGQFLVRALLFRIIADWIAQRELAATRARAYESGISLAVSLTEGP